MAEGVRIAQWSAGRVEEAVERVLLRRVSQAAIYVRDETKQLINRGNPDGDDPSLPGEPPKKVTGRLFQSYVATPARRDGQSIVAQIGTNVEYARRLELGFAGTDARGRLYDQAPRPFMRPGLFGSRDALMRILGVRR